MATREAKIIIKAVDQAKDVLKGHEDQIGGLKASTAALAAGSAAAAAALIATAKAVTELVDEMATLGDEMDKTSARTGVAVENLDRWNYVVRLGGGSQQDFETGARRLQRALYDADRGVKESLDGFERLGVSIRDSSGELRSADDVMFDIADAMAGLSSDTERAALAQTLLGRGGTRLIPTLKQGAAAIREQMDELAGLGGVMDEDFAKSSAKMVDAQLRMEIAWRNVKMAFAEPFIEEADGGINDLAASIGDFAGTVSEHSGELRQFASDLVAATGAAVELASALAKFNDSDINKFMQLMWNPLQQVRTGIDLGRRAFGGGSGFGEPSLIDPTAAPGPWSSSMYDNTYLQGLRDGRAAAIGSGMSGGYWSGYDMGPAGGDAATQDARARNARIEADEAHRALMADLYDSTDAFGDDDPLKGLNDSIAKATDGMDDFKKRMAQVDTFGAQVAGQLRQGFATIFDQALTDASKLDKVIARMILRMAANAFFSSLFTGGPVAVLSNAIGGGGDFSNGIKKGAAGGYSMSPSSADSENIWVQPGEAILDRELTFELKRLTSVMLGSPNIAGIGGQSQQRGEMRVNVAYPTTTADLNRISREMQRAEKRSYIG